MAAKRLKDSSEENERFKEQLLEPTDDSELVDDPLIEENVGVDLPSIADNAGLIPPVQTDDIPNRDHYDHPDAAQLSPHQSLSAQPPMLSKDLTVYDQVRSALRDHDLSNRPAMLSKEDIDSLAALISAKTVQMTKDIHDNEACEDNGDWMDLENKFVCRPCLANSKSEYVPKNIKIKNVTNFGFISKSQESRLVKRFNL